MSTGVGAVVVVVVDVDVVLGAVDVAGAALLEDIDDEVLEVVEKLVVVVEEGITEVVT